MTAAVKIIKSTQTNAPQITGLANSLNPVLYAALCTGFNSVTLTSLTVSSNIATGTTASPHGFGVNDTVQISGANQSVFNNDFEIDSVPTTTSFTFPLITNTATATGTITCKISPLGWNRPDSSGNLSIYQSADVLSSKCFFKIDDSAGVTAALTAYEYMSSVNSGSGASPTVYINKSSAASSATRAWIIIGNSKCFYLFIERNASYPNYEISFIGDINSLIPNDPWRFAIGACSVNSSYNGVGNASVGMNTSNATVTGNYLMRAAHGFGGSVSFGIQTAVPMTRMGYVGLSTAYPSLVDHCVHLLPCYNFEYYSSSYYLRGIQPGLYPTVETVGWAYTNLDRSLVFNGRVYVPIRLAYTATGGCTYLDATGPW